MMNRHRLTLEIGDGDYQFLAAVAKVAGITPQDMLAACWKIGAGAYAAQVMGYELPRSLTSFTPDTLTPIFRDFLAQYGGDVKA
jgi:hypothetical protein